MKETELKFEVQDFKGLRQALQKIGANLVWKGTEQNYYFDTIDKKLEKAGIDLRLRKWEGHSNTLTLKLAAEKNKTVKVRQEFQIEINDISIMSRILKILGFFQIFRYEKAREHWQLKDASVELDKLNNKYFVEIEASQKRIGELGRFLNLDPTKSTAQGYLEILKEIKLKKTS